MSYAGVYGSDETCPHNVYRPNCWRCNGAVERFAREFPNRLRHAEEVDKAGVVTRIVRVYDVLCPGCTGREDFPTEAKAQEWLAHHACRVKAVAAGWDAEHEMRAEAVRRGLL